MRIETITGEIREVKGEFVEPIQLQVVCQRLWRERLSLSNTSTPLSNTLSPHDIELLADVDAALSDFYVNTIHEAAKQCRIYEGDLRRWFEDKLITSSGTRAFVHRDTESTGGMPNQVVDILENMHIVRQEWRSGSPWFELTHDRLIEPIKNSNRLWRQDNRWEIWLQANIGLKKTRNAISKRPIGITTIVYLSVIFGGILLSAAHAIYSLNTVSRLSIQQEFFAKAYGYLLITFGITYIALGIGFRRADVWAFTLYNYVNYSLVFITLFWSYLTVTVMHSEWLDSTRSAIFVLISQSSSIVYTFVVARYLNNKRVKSYFYQNVADARLSQL